jgi:hypothetical protein
MVDHAYLLLDDTVCDFLGVIMRRVLVCVVVSVAVGGCATSSDKITASYVSPMQYENWNCRQLAEEAQRVSHHAAAAAGAQDSQVTKDAVATTVGVIVFWPALFLIGGDKQGAAELARLKGEMDAIEQTSIRKKCGIQFQRPTQAQAAAVQ